MCLLHKAGCPLERLLSWFSSELGVGEETGALFDDCFFLEIVSFSPHLLPGSI